MAAPDILIPRGGRPALLDPAVFDAARALRLNRVLVPLDGSQLSEYALPYAAMITKWLDGEMTLFHALQPMHPAKVARAGTVPYPDEQHDRGTYLASSYLEEIATRLRPHGVRARWSVATGETAHMISSRSVAGGFGLAVLAASPRSRVLRPVQPGVMERLWRFSPVPLLLVNRSRIAVNGNPLPEPDTFIVPLDGTQKCLAALPVASVLTNAVRGRVLLITVGKAAPEPDTTASQSPFVSRAVRYLGERGTAVTVETSKNGDITGVARRQIQLRGSWVIAGSRMRSGFNRILLGSHGDQFLRQCRGPLIVVPDPDVAEERAKKSHAQSLLPPESPR